MLIINSNIQLQKRNKKKLDSLEGQNQDSKGPNEDDATQLKSEILGKKRVHGECKRHFKEEKNPAKDVESQRKKIRI